MILNFGKNSLRNRYSFIAFWISSWALMGCCEIQNVGFLFIRAMIFGLGIKDFGLWLLRREILESVKYFKMSFCVASKYQIPLLWSKQ